MSKKSAKPKKDLEHPFVCQVCWNPVPGVTKVGRCDFCEVQWTRIVSAYNKLLSVFPEFKKGSIAESYERLVLRALKASSSAAVEKPRTAPIGAAKF